MVGRDVVSGFQWKRGGLVAVTRIQQVLFELEAEYMGHPYFVSGNALYTALARRVDDRARQALCVSMGVFVPGEFGSYPEAHSHGGGVPYMGTGLRPVEAYEDLFLFRDAAQCWLSESRPRDAHNTHDIRSHGGRLTVAPTMQFGRPAESRYTRRSVTWYVHCYVHAAGSDGGADVIPVSEDVLNRLRVGGGRNYGFGELSVKETQTIDLDALDYSRVRDADRLQLELVSPYVLDSSFPGADGQSVPWWWETEAETGTGADTDGGERLRRRATRLVAGDDVHDVTVVDHGQVVGYAGDRPVETAKNGVLRVGTHAKLGFGEFRLRPADAARVQVQGRSGAGAGSGSDRGAGES